MLTAAVLVADVLLGDDAAGAAIAVIVAVANDVVVVVGDAVVDVVAVAANSSLQANGRGRLNAGLVSKAAHRLAQLFLVLRAPVLKPNLYPRGVQLDLERQGLPKRQARVAILPEGLLKHVQLILVKCCPVPLVVHFALAAN